VNHNSDRGPWESTPGLTARMVELHALGGPDYLSMRDIAEKLNREFNTRLTRNAIIGRAHRLNLPRREEPKGARSMSTKKGRQPSKRGPYKSRVDAPIMPVCQAPRCTDGGISIYQLGYGDCRWVLDPIEAVPPYSYCGKQVVTDGVSWCPDHFKVVHPSTLRRQA